MILLAVAFVIVGHYWLLSPSDAPTPPQGAAQSEVVRNLERGGYTNVRQLTTPPLEVLGQLVALSASRSDNSDPSQIVVTRGGFSFGEVSSDRVRVMDMDEPIIAIVKANAPESNTQRTLIFTDSMLLMFTVIKGVKPKDLPDTRLLLQLVERKSGVSSNYILK